MKTSEEPPKPIKSERIDNSDGTYTVKNVYDKPNSEGYLSSIEQFELNKCLKADYFNDAIFQNIIKTITIEYKDNIIIHKIINYEYEQFYEMYYDEQSRLIRELYYADINFSKVITTLDYKYNNDGSCISKIIDISENNRDKTGCSYIAYMDKRGKCIKRKAYYDKNFSKCHSLTNFKHNNDNSYISYTSYNNSTINGYLSEIEKYDKEGNLIYKHQYKFKGLLAKIIFWFSW